MSEAKETTKAYTKRDVTGFLADISEQIVDSQGNYLHSFIALNEILNQPNAEKVFDEELKSKAKELWIKLKASGLEVNDPPLLFGVPELGKGEDTPKSKSKGKTAASAKK